MKLQVISKGHLNLKRSEKKEQHMCDILGWEERIIKLSFLLTFGYEFNIVPV